MCRKSKFRYEGAKIRYGGLINLVYAVLILIIAAGIPALATVPITVENYSFEIPEDGMKRDINVGTPGIVTGWARTDPITSAGREYGYTPTEGTATAFLGKDALIFNLTDFLTMAGDKFQMLFDARSTWQGSNLLAQLYYDDVGREPEGPGNRRVFATTIVDLSQQSVSATFAVDSNAVGPAMNDHKIGIQFKHEYVEGLWPDDNIWAGIDYIELSLLTPLMRAQDPFPEHESSYGDSSVSLTWVPGPDAPTVDNYHIYLSEDWADVNDGALDADKGLTNTPSYQVTDLVRGETYYWRIDTVIGADSQNGKAHVYRGNIWNFVAKPLIAYNPYPSAGADFVAVDPVLSWQAGSGAVEGHVVVIGDNFNDVNNIPVGTSGIPSFRAYLTNPADTNWAPEEAGLTLETNKVYYWRIDEVESASPQTIHKGEVWQFTTVPIKGLGSITRDLWEDIEGVAVADLTNDPNYPDSPSYTENLLSFEAPHMAIVNYGSRVHGWLYIRNSGEYTFWIASGETSQLWFGSHPSTASIIAFVDGEEGREGWTQPRQWDKYPEIQQSDPIYLEGGGNFYYIMVLHKKGWGYDNLSAAWMGPDSNGIQEVIPGSSLIPFDQVELTEASGPIPVARAMGVQREPTFSWVAGEYAATHDIYLGTDVNAVNDASRGNDPLGIGVSQNQSATTYEPGILDFNTTYYWRVDEVNDAHPDKLWKGNVWSFTIGNYLIVDDFEDYNDYTPNRTFDVWADYAVNNTGMTVGHLDPPFAEQRIVHSGRQAMYMLYDNDGTVNEGTDYEQSGTLLYSEAERQWVDPQDWTREGVESLTLWLRGIPASVGSFSSGPPITMTGAGADIWSTSDHFHYAYKRLSGVGSITAKVVSMTNTNNSAKAGVMIRESLEPGSAHAMMNIQPINEVQFLRRLEMGFESETDGQGEISTPVWVRLTRSGNTLTGDYSVDGATWETLGSATIPMVLDVYIGLIVCSHDSNATCTAEFSDVTTTGTVTGDWQSQDVGIESNIAEPMYIVLADSDGNSAVVNNSDPSATTIGIWTEWNIPLLDFAGVNMQAIKSMAIGVGDKANTALRGAGTLYIDDIRLYRPSPSK